MSRKPSKPRGRGGKGGGESPKDYQVGYARPPKSGQFKPGVCPNPKGRPKGTKNLKSKVRSVMSQKVPVIKRGRRSSIATDEAILHVFKDLSLKGNVKTAAFLFSLQESLGGAEPDKDDDALSDQDKQILRTLFEQMGRKPPD